MSSRRRFLFALAVVTAIAGAACGTPPDKEMQQAQAAIDAARASGADRFAREEFAAAEDALKRSHDAVAQRDYRQALNNALDARERAQTAARETADRKAAARADAERAARDMDALLHETRAKLKAAETARTPAKALAASRRTIADGETAVQEARTAFEREDYLSAIETSRNATARLRDVARDLDALAPPNPRRRR